MNDDFDVGARRHDAAKVPLDYVSLNIFFRSAGRGKGGIYGA